MQIGTVLDRGLVNKIKADFPIIYNRDISSIEILDAVAASRE